MEVIKSSRFWLALIIILGAFVLAVLKLISGSEAIAATVGILGGFGVAKAGSGSSSSAGAVALVLCLCVGLAACVTTSTGQRQFDPVKAVDTACDLQPAVSTIAEKGVCENLPEPRRSKCIRINKLVSAGSSAALAIAGAITEACQVPQQR